MRWDAKQGKCRPRTEAENLYIERRKAKRKGEEPPALKAASVFGTSDYPPNYDSALDTTRVNDVVAPQERLSTDRAEHPPPVLSRVVEEEPHQEVPLVDVSITPVQDKSSQIELNTAEETPLDKPVSEVEMYNEPAPVLVNDANQAPGLNDLGHTGSVDETKSVDETGLAKETKSALPIQEELAENPALYSQQEEKREYEANGSMTNPDGYPFVSDSKFQEKIASSSEFFGQQYDTRVYDIAARADELCHAEFELTPHQLFIKNFLSPETPYNSLLLYHGLGTGKTCTAIGVAESYREYMKQTGHIKKILVVADKNVRSNFELQLFDEPLFLSKGQLSGCVGSSLLDEVSPFLSSREDTVERTDASAKVRKVIKKYYDMTGYVRLARIISDLIRDKVSADNKMTPEAIAAIQHYFDDRLVIIDEVHNIRQVRAKKQGISEATGEATGEGEEGEDVPVYGDDAEKERKTTEEMGKIGELLTLVATHAQNMRLLLLSATPVYDNFAEIVWLTNLLNLNDKRPPIAVGDVFALKDTADLKRGQFLEARTLPSGIVLESGRELLARKLTGYVSYVRSENPYAFPFRVYPDVFAPERTLGGALFPIPKKSYDGQEITDPLRFLKVYGSPMHALQQDTYRKIVGWYRSQNRMQLIMMYLVQACNMVYGSIPSDRPNQIQVRNALGERGFSTVIKRTNRKSYAYADKTVPRLFSPALLPQYSCKIASIVESIKNATGIVIVYSKFIEIGVVSVALALEEAGFLRYGGSGKNRTLFANGLPDVPKLDATTSPLRPTESGSNPAQYIMITGDGDLSPNNVAHVALASSPENKDGHLIKVILISDAGSEGIDFKNVRQVHVLEPWYNMNKIEQVIGRAVRNKSHCSLPFVERNVEIYLHTCVMDWKSDTTTTTLSVPSGKQPGLLQQLGLAGGAVVQPTNQEPAPQGNGVYQGTTPSEPAPTVVEPPVQESLQEVGETMDQGTNDAGPTVSQTPSEGLAQPNATSGISPATSGISPATSGTSPATSGTSPATSSPEPQTEIIVNPPVPPPASSEPSTLASLAQGITNTVKSVGETLSNMVSGPEKDAFKPVMEQPTAQESLPSEHIGNPSVEPLQEGMMPTAPLRETQPTAPLRETQPLEQESLPSDQIDNPSFEPLQEEISMGQKGPVSTQLANISSQEETLPPSNIPPVGPTNQVFMQSKPEADSQSQPTDQAESQPTVQATQSQPTDQVDSEEAIDLCIYRKYAEKKALTNGQITRLLKEVSVDCLLNLGQMNMTVEKLQSIDANRKIQIHLSSSLNPDAERNEEKEYEATRRQQLTPFDVGDRPGTDICDYMESCQYTNKKAPTAPATASSFSGMRQVATFLLPRIKALFRQHTFLSRDELIYELSRDRPVPIEQMYAALNILINDKSQYVVDPSGRIGHVVSFETSYFFQPADLTDPRASVFERTIPLAVRQSQRMILLPTGRSTAAQGTMAAKGTMPPIQGSLKAAPVKTAAQWAADLADTRVSRSASYLLRRSQMVLAFATNPATIWDDLDETEYIDQPEILEEDRALRSWCNLVRRLLPVLDRLGLVDELPAAIIDHYFDTLPLADRLTLLQEPGTDRHVSAYFTARRVAEDEGVEEIYNLYSPEEGKLVWMRCGYEGGFPVWSPVSVDYAPVQMYLGDTALFQQFRMERLFPVFGFLWRRRDNWVFKLKDKKVLPGDRNTAKEGAACGTHGFKLMRAAAGIEGPSAPIFQAIATLNDSSDNRRQHTTLPELCVLSEIALRSLNVSDPDHTYFMTSEMFSTLYGNI